MITKIIRNINHIPWILIPQIFPNPITLILEEPSLLYSFSTVLDDAFKQDSSDIFQSKEQNVSSQDSNCLSKKYTLDSLYNNPTNCFINKILTVGGSMQDKDTSISRILFPNKYGFNLSSHVHTLKLAYEFMYKKDTNISYFVEPNTYCLN